MSKKLVSSLVLTAALTLTTSPLFAAVGGSTSGSQAVGGSNPAPQAVGGSNPAPQAVGGSNPAPQSAGSTSSLPDWVVVLLSVSSLG